MTLTVSGLKLPGASQATLRRRIRSAVEPRQPALSRPAPGRDLGSIFAGPMVGHLGREHRSTCAFEGGYLRSRSARSMRMCGSLRSGSRTPFSKASALLGLISNIVSLREMSMRPRSRF